MNWIVESQTRVPLAPVVSQSTVSIDAERVDAVSLESSSSVETLRSLKVRVHL